MDALLERPRDRHAAGDKAKEKHDVVYLPHPFLSTDTALTAVVSWGSVEEIGRHDALMKRVTNVLAVGSKCVIIDELAIAESCFCVWRQRWVEIIGYSWNKVSDWVLITRKIRDDSLFCERGQVFRV
jgi:hypothetical protein